LQEIQQPFRHVGLEWKAKHALPFHSDLTLKRPAGAVEEAGFVELPLARIGSSCLRDDRYFLVRDDRGQTGLRR
jgi:hypothetical protein